MAEAAVEFSSNQTGAGTETISLDADKAKSDFILGILIIVANVIMLVVSLCGVITNILNIAVFRKQLGGDPINLNFFYLAVSDGAGCLVSVITIGYSNQWFSAWAFTKYNLFAPEVFGMIIRVPHSFFMRISIMLTTLLTMSRCLSVVFPMKARSIVTRKSMSITIGVVYVLSFIPAIPIYYVNRLAWVYQPHLNGTYLRRVVTSNFISVNLWFGPLDILLYQMIPYVTMIVCTSILISSLRKRSNWRQKAVASSTEQDVAKENKVVKMVVLIAVVFISCYIYNVASFLANALGTVWNFNELEKHKWLLVVGVFVFILDSVNASSNFFIYYKTSSKFKQAVDTMFRGGEAKKETKE